MRMKLSFSLLKALPQVPLGLKHFENISFIIFLEKELIFLLQHATFEVTIL